MIKKPKMNLSDEVYSPAIRDVQKRVEDNAETLDRIVSRVVQTHCQPLDDYMEYIKGCVTDRDNPPTNIELDEFTLRLPVLLYFAGEAMESLGIREDIAKAIRTELYSNAYDEAGGTIGDKTATAELAVQNETITQIVYQRAYKKVKLKMEIGNEMLQSVKKVIGRRVSEYSLSRVNDDRFERKDYE